MFAGGAFMNTVKELLSFLTLQTNWSAVGAAGGHLV